MLKILELWSERLESGQAAQIHLSCAKTLAAKSCVEQLLGDGPGQFQLPHGVAVDRGGTVYVADRENSRIQVFSPLGEFLGQLTFARPTQVFLTGTRIPL